MSESKLRSQSMDFAVSIINLVKALKEANETGYWLELFIRRTISAKANIKHLILLARA